MLMAAAEAPTDAPRGVSGAIRSPLPAAWAAAEAPTYAPREISWQIGSSSPAAVVGAVKRARFRPTRAAAAAAAALLPHFSVAPVGSAVRRPAVKAAAARRAAAPAREGRRNTEAPAARELGDRR